MKTMTLTMLAAFGLLLASAAPVPAMADDNMDIGVAKGAAPPPPPPPEGGYEDEQAPPHLSDGYPVPPPPEGAPPADESGQVPPPPPPPPEESAPSQSSHEGDKRGLAPRGEHHSLRRPPPQPQ